MSAAMVAALASILIPCGCVAWNMSLPQRTMKPFMEGVATSISSAFAVVSLVAGGSGAAPLLGTVGLLLSFPLLVLTFLSRLPSRRSTAAVEKLGHGLIVGGLGVDDEVVCSHGEIAGLDVNAKLFAQLPGGRSTLRHFLDGLTLATVPKSVSLSIRETPVRF